ncbi:MAG: DUF1587 domain-containing protein, partial [Planctomycetota bacterium]
MNSVPRVPLSSQSRSLLAAAVLLMLTGFASPRSVDAEEGHYEQHILPILQQACFECHRGDQAEGNFRADRLDPDLITGDDVAWWLEVYAVLSKEEMPPPESTELTDEQRSRVIEWLSEQIQSAEQQRKASNSQSSFRRLTRYEYNYALQDLLHVPWTFADELPSEVSHEGGFENDA